MAAIELTCGYCGNPIALSEVRDTSDLERGYDHIATPRDWGVPETRSTRWKHTETFTKSRYYQPAKWTATDYNSALARLFFANAVARFGDAYEHHLDCLAPLLGRDCADLDHARCKFALPDYTKLMDHGTLFRRNGTTTAIVGQPYGPLAVQQLADALRACAALGIRIELGAEGWHYPGRTLAVIFTRAEGRRL